MLSLSRIRITLVWLNSLSGIPYSNFILGLAHLSPAQVQSPVHTQIFFTWVKPRPNKKTELDQPGSESIRSVLEFPSGGVSRRVFDQPWCLWRVSTCVGVPRRVFNQRWCFTMSFRPVFEYSGVIQPYLLASTRFQWFLETFGRFGVLWWCFGWLLVLFWPVPTGFSCVSNGSYMFSAGFSFVFGQFSLVFSRFDDISVGSIWFSAGLVIFLSIQLCFGQFGCVFSGLGPYLGRLLFSTWLGQGIANPIHRQKEK